MALTDLGVFWRGDHVLAVHALVVLGHGHPIALEIEFCGSERQHLAQTEPAPIEQLECDERLRLVHDLPAEAQILILCPEAHFVSLLAADLADLRHGIRFEPVVADGMVDYSGELIADRVQVGTRDRCPCAWP